MLYRRSTLFALPAAAALFGAGIIAPAAAQTVVTVPYQPVQSTIVVAPTAPPAPETETIPPPPSGETTYAWTPGHWNWNGASWVWQSGSYVQRVAPPQPSAVWVPGQWQQQPSGGYVWVAGHWQV